MLSPVLIIDSSQQKHQSLLNVFDKLAQKDNLFFLLSSNDFLSAQFKVRNWQHKKLFFSNQADSALSQIIFLCLYGYFWLRMFFKILDYKLNQKIKTVVCLGLKEKMLIGLIAKILKIKLIWIEEAPLDKNKLTKILLVLYRLNSRPANIISFCENHQQHLINAGIAGKQIFLVNPGAEPSAYQNNIFNEIVSAEQKSYHKKYFTLGTIASLNSSPKNNLETIFRAVKISLSIIPNLQLIIIGDGPERKNLQWLTKKMGIDSLVWFVGEQTQLTKWLLSFDVYIEGEKNIQLENLTNALNAMLAQLPIIGPRDSGLEEVVAENRTGTLIEMNDEEMLARQIIKIQQNKKLKQQIGKNGQQNVKNNFSLAKTVATLHKIINQ